MGRNDLKFFVQDVEDVLEREMVLRGRECELEPESASIHIRLRIQKCGAEILVEGRVKSEIDFPCALCLEPAGLVIDESFQSSVKIRPGAEIDALPDVRDSFMAGVPMKTVCTEACKGLCPSCGKNLNREPCACVPPEEKRSLKHLLDEALDKGSD